MRRLIFNVCALTLLCLTAAPALAIECVTPLAWQQKLRDTPLDTDGNFVQDSLQGLPEMPTTVVVDLVRCPQPGDVTRLEGFGEIAYVGRWVSFLVMEGVLPSTFDALGQDPAVAFVEENGPAQTFLDLSREVVGADAAATSYGVSGAGVTIAVMDTGVDDGVHVGLPASAFEGGLDCTGCTCSESGAACFSDSDCPSPFDTCSCSCSGSPDSCLTDSECPGSDNFCAPSLGCVETNPDDDIFHGTHVASIALGRGGGECPDCVGVAPAAGLVDVKVFRSTRRALNANLLVGAEALLDKSDDFGVDIVNMSLGFCQNTNGTDAFSMLANRMVDAGLVVVASAGNAGPACGLADESVYVLPPAAADKAISVANQVDGGTVTLFDDEINATSLRGPRASDGDADTADEEKPDIAAPGTSITAVKWDTADEYGASTGTSQAAPHVAGCAALLLEQLPEMTPLSLKSLLLDTAVDLGPAGWDAAWGQGALDCFAAVDEVGVTIGTDLGFEVWFCRPGDPACWRSPDLVPADPKIEEGVPNMVMATVTNFGDVPAPEFDVELGVYNFGNGQESYPICVTSAPAGLPPGESTTVSCEYVPSVSGPPPGSVHACLKARIIYPFDTNTENNRAQHNINIRQSFSPAPFEIDISNPTEQPLDLVLNVQWTCECPPAGSGVFQCPCPGWVFETDDPVIPLGPDDCPVTTELRLEPVDPALAVRNAIADVAVIGMEPGGGGTPIELSGVTVEAELACQTDFLQFLDKDQFVWQPPPWQVCPDLFDVIRGELPIQPLPDGVPGGEFFQSQCIGIDLQNPFYFDNQPLLPGQGFYYLTATGSPQEQPGSWNDPLPSQIGNRDRTAPCAIDPPGAMEKGGAAVEVAPLAVVAD